MFKCLRYSRKFLPSMVLVLFLTLRICIRSSFVKHLSKYEILGFVVAVLAIGSLTLAVIDPSARPAFADLTKVAVGAYIGLLMPKP